MKKLPIPLVSVLAAFGFMASPAILAIGQPSPVGPSPQGPFVQTGATILPVNPTTCMTFPANVTGGCKGAGTWNVSGLYVNGANIQTQDMTIGATNVLGGTIGNILGIGASNKLSATATTGTGNVVLGTGPSLTTPSISSPTVSGGMTYGGVSVGASPTGTGNLVLGTSPSLTTPNLGTPSAATLTNATGLPPGGIAAIAANTVVGNATASSASPTALSVPSCSTSSSALTWTSASGFGCNSIQGAAITGTPAANNIATWADSTHVQGTTAIPNGTTATTQSGSDNSTLVATTAQVQAAIALGGVPTGTVVAYAGSSAPSGWLLCGGQAVSRTGANTALFTLLGTTYGAGDGSTTFNLPDLRGRVAAGVDNMGGVAANRLGSGSTGGITGSATLAASGGQQSHTLTSSEQASMSAGSAIVSVGGLNTGGAIVDSSPGGSWVSSVSASSGSLTAIGGGGAHNVVQPTLVLNMLIKQ